MKVSIILIVFLLLTASMGKIHYQLISLEELIERSSCIFIVEKEEPFVEQKKIKFIKLFKSVPAFTKMTYSYKVISSLCADYDCEIDSGQIIKVRQAHYESMLNLHKKYYIKGISKSPIYTKYEKKVNIADEKTIIVFLNKDKNEYEYTAIGAHERIEMKDAIFDLISKKGLLE